jgi:hypothetical protein
LDELVEPVPNRFQPADDRASLTYQLAEVFGCLLMMCT